MSNASACRVGSVILLMSAVCCPAQMGDVMLVYRGGALRVDWGGGFAKERLVVLVYTELLPVHHNFVDRARHSRFLRSYVGLYSEKQQ